MKISTASTLVCAASVLLSAQVPADNPRMLWVDFDRDGLEDLYHLAGGDRGTADRLLRNLGNGRFADVTGEAGVAGLSSVAGWSADYDRDDDQDLLLLQAAGGARLLCAEQGYFIDAGIALGAGEAIVGAQWLDYDRDGWLDVVLDRKAGAPLVLHNEQGGGFLAVDLGLAPLDASSTGPSVGVVADPAREAASAPAPANDAGNSDVASRGPARNRNGSLARGPVRASPPLDATGNPTDVSPTGLPPGSVPLGPLGGGPVHPLDCALTIEDHAGGACIAAARTPALDQLVPESIALNTLGNQVNIGTTTPGAFDLNVVGATKSLGLNGPTNGYLGIAGATSFDGIGTAQWAGFDVGVAGVSTGGSLADNYGVLGHSDGVGVRGEHAAGRAVDYGELGTAGHGLRADGTTAAARLLGAAHFEKTGGLVTLNINEDDVGGASISGFTDNGALSFFLDTDWGFLEAPRMLMYDGADSQLGIDLEVGLTDGGGTIRVYNDAAGQTIEIDGETGDGASIELFDDAGLETVDIDSDFGGGGRLDLNNDTGIVRMVLIGDSLGGGGYAGFWSAGGYLTVGLDAEADSLGGYVSVRNNTGEPTMELIGDEGDDAGEIVVVDRNGSTIRNAITIDGRDAVGTGGEIVMLGTQGSPTVDIDGDNGGGALQLFESDGSSACEFIGSVYSFQNGAGVTTISFNRLTGTKSAVVDTPSFGQRLFYVLESPEVWFEDFGTARLEEGEARIDLDPIFLESVTIDDAHPMMAHATPTSGSTGLWVEPGTDHFVVHAAQGASGTAGNATFSWRVVAKRKGVESVRLEPYADVLAEETALMHPPLKQERRP